MDLIFNEYFLVEVLPYWLLMAAAIVCIIRNL